MATSNKDENQAEEKSDDHETDAKDDVHDDENGVTKEGYLMKKLLYIKKFRKIFIILRENHLFCYTNHKKTEITELIDLGLFEKAEVTEKEIAEFKLLPKNEERKTRIFLAESIDDANEWVSTINYSIDPAKQEQNDEGNEYENMQNKAEEQGMNLSFIYNCYL